MTRCWINFRIHKDDGYEHRYSTLMKMVDAAVSIKWEGGTSFFIVKSDLGARDLALSICSSLRTDTDVLLVGEVSSEKLFYYGKPVDLLSLKKLYPFMMSLETTPQ